MKLEEFNYELPQGLIARELVRPRDHCRLFVLNRRTSETTDTHFHRIIDYVEPGDTIVTNDTKAFHSQLRGRKPDGGFIDLVLVSRKAENRWDCLVLSTRRPLQVNSTLAFSEGELVGTVVKQNELGTGWLIDFESRNGKLDDLIQRLGKLFLPIYLPQTLQDPNDYQTVYAAELGSVQPPVAGMHFTEELLDRIREKGVQIVSITLHVGRLDTFSPAAIPQMEQHRMYPEWYRVSTDVVEAVNGARRRGKRVFAIGTTVAKTLETVAVDGGFIEEREGWSELFIYPGHQWKVVDALVSNLQPPMSSHLVLACAFAGRDLVLEMHGEAVRRSFRFLEFGDAALYV